MSQWAHGYNVSQGYTYGFYRERAPDWIDFCMLAAGMVPPARGDDGTFRYLELGCGQGFGLCALAAANPAAEFVGIDFHAGHIAHAAGLAAAAKLTNVRFIEGDFTELGARWPADLGRFEYVALHGIYSWIPPLVRQALVVCLTEAVATGGAVYNSYNTQPGWLSAMPFQHIAHRLQTTMRQSNEQAIDASVALFEEIFAVSPALADGLPLLRARVADIKNNDNVAYLGQEYLNGSWQLFWFSQVAEELAAAKLDYVGSATAVEQLLPGILPARAQKLVAGQSDPVLAQEVLDCVVAQTFRRDIFCRGSRPVVAAGPDTVMEATFHRLVAKVPAEVKISTTFGEMMLQPDVFGPILVQLEEGTMTLAELSGLPVFKGATHANIMQTVMMMLDAGLIAMLPRRPVDPEPGRRFNKAVARMASQGSPYAHLVTPTIASALPVNDLNCMLMDSYLSDHAGDEAALAAGLLVRMQRVGRRMVRDGKPLEGQAERQHLAELAEAFLADLPRWRALGAIA